MIPSEAWRYYVQAYEDLAKVRQAMHTQRGALEPHISASLLKGGSECAAALDFVRYLDCQAQIRLLPALLGVALTVSGDTSNARRVIAAMPRREVVSHIRNNHSLRGDYEEYACMLELWIELDCVEEAEALAEEASASINEDVQEIGSIYLEKIRKLRETSPVPPSSNEAPDVS